MLFACSAAVFRSIYTPTSTVVPDAVRPVRAGAQSLPLSLALLALTLLGTSLATPAEAGRLRRAAQVQLPVQSEAAPAPQGLLTNFDDGANLQSSADGQSELLAGLTPVPLAGIDASSNPGTLSIQYQGGTPSQRRAQMVADPAGGSNHVLGFFLQQANVENSGAEPDKGRVQLNAYDADVVRAKEVRFSTRMYLPADVGLLRSMTRTFDWLTVSEWWNDAGWAGQAYPFRVSVNIVKPTSRRGTQIYFQARAASLNLETNFWSTIHWQVTNRSVPVPVGRWVTLEYSYLEGNASTGRFYLAMTPDGGARTVLFDIRGWTYHPSNPAPDGVTHINPLKLYTSKTIIDYVRNAGGVLSVFWDDPAFRLCAERGPESSSPCAPASFQ